MKFKKVFVILVCISIISVFSLTSISVGATSGMYYNGAWKHMNNNGAAVQIETQNPYVSSSSILGAWAMTCDVINGEGYAQVGWLKEYGDSGPCFFYEYNYDPDAVWYRWCWGSPSIGSFQDFMVGCSSYKMYFKINGYEYGEVSLTTIPFARNYVECFTETHNTNDQSPGSNANPVSFGYAQYKTTSNVWTDLLYYNPSAHGYGSLSTMRNNIATSGDSFWEVWDSRY